MQFQTKRVIKIFSLLSIVLIVFGCEKPKSDDVLLLEKIITKEFSSKDSIEISSNANFRTKLISNYHKVRFLDETPITIYGGYGTDKNKIVKAPKEEQEKLNNSIIKQFEHPDIRLSQEDIESMIEQQKKIEDWASQEIDDLKIKLKNNSILNTYQISRPVYSLDNKYAIIHYNLPNKFSHLVFCKKEGDEWVFIKTLEKIL